MLCRCAEIQNLEKTLGELNDARSYLNNYNTNLSMFRTETVTLCSNITLALYDSHAEAIKENINKKVEKFSPISIDMEGKISVKVTELLNEIRSLQEEDTAYHEEEQKRLLE